MTVVAQPQEAAAGFDGVTFGRTVDRALVHRTALAEVFLTDLARVGDDRFVAAAQLPRAHSYYGDHVLPSGTVDPLLLQECCRQAATMLVHRFFDVPMDTAFLVTRWEMDLTAPAPVCPAGRPGELEMAIGTHEVKIRGGLLASMSLAIEMSLAGKRIGVMHIGAAYLPAERYRAFRRLRRAEPPMSDQVPARGTGIPAAPALVGRRHEDNVVLADPVATGDKVVAALDVPTAHPSLYDHPLDHVPAMALLEAARQIALAAAGHGTAGRLYYPGGVAAEFTKFVELDQPVRLSAVSTGDRVEVDFVQNDEVVCTATVRVAAVSGEPAVTR